MTSIELITLMNVLDRQEQKRCFTLREIALLSGKTRPAVGMALQRAAEKKIVARTGTLWINMLHPPEAFELALALVAPSYLSFESALYHHGVLSQSPRGVVSVATPGRSRSLSTPVGMVQAIHLKSALFFGFDADRMASPEKAWLDLLYIRGRRGQKEQFSETFYRDRLRSSQLRSFLDRFPPWVATMNIDNP